MKIEEFREYLDKYIHGELDPSLSNAMDLMIKEDPLCGLEYEEELKFEALLKKSMKCEEAPYELRESVIKKLDRSPFAWFTQKFKSVSLLGRLVTSALVVLLVVVSFTRNTNAFPIFAASIARHVECLKGSVPIEVKTSDIAVITKWFEGKLPFSVNPPDLSAKGVELKGARLCHLKDKKVALIFYEANEKPISLWMIDSRDMTFPKKRNVSVPGRDMYVDSEMGYSSLLCLEKAREGVGCVIVSDMSEEDLVGLMS
jgi:anti-sigma factor RsiW